MTTATLVCILVTVALVAAFIPCEALGLRRGSAVLKPLASTGFIATALAAGALESLYGKAVLVALGLGWLGDVLLIPRTVGRAFRLGVISFLAGHLAFALAFAMRGIDALWLALAIVPLGLVAAAVLRWLMPHVTDDMRRSVLAYVCVISVMVAVAAGTVGAGEPLLIGAGAVAFYLSDLAVARERFVHPSPVNRMVGLPLYYGGQLALAFTVSLP